MQINSGIFLSNAANTESLEEIILFEGGPPLNPDPLINPYDPVQIIKIIQTRLERWNTGKYTFHRQKTHCLQMKRQIRGRPPLIWGFFSSHQISGKKSPIQRKIYPSYPKLTGGIPRWEGSEKGGRAGSFCIFRRLSVM